jgi:hypothetical protein
MTANAHEQWGASGSQPGVKAMNAHLEKVRGACDLDHGIRALDARVARDARGTREGHLERQRPCRDAGQRATGACGHVMCERIDSQFQRRAALAAGQPAVQQRAGEQEQGAQRSNQGRRRTNTRAIRADRRAYRCMQRRLDNHTVVLRPCVLRRERHPSMPCAFPVFGLKSSVKKLKTGGILRHLPFFDFFGRCS